MTPKQIPTRAAAEALLRQGAARNPGGWVGHSRHVALAAEALASRLVGLDPESAYIVGLLHDIGRQEGPTNMRHVLDGYLFLADLGHDDAARICLTHSFVIQDVHAHAGVWDCTAAELELVTAVLLPLTYSDYDRLIQLCDALALPDGCALLEKRLVDIALRHGLNDYTLPRWRAIFGLQAYFEQALGGSIYNHLPGVVAATFGNLYCAAESPH